LQLLLPMWRTADVDMMKVEITRINVLRARLALGRYRELKHAPAQRLEALVEAHLLDQIPINYSTGRALTWAEVNAPASSEKE